MDALEMQSKVALLLRSHANSDYAKEELSEHIAQASLLMRHLYEDLGFASRTQMGAFMKEHFPLLAARKPKEVLWKKFLYDEIGGVAPACAGCLDAVTCFKCTTQEASA